MHLSLAVSALWFSFSLSHPVQVVLNNCPNGEANCEGQQGAVASENKICSSIGVDLLKAGGNAADAVGRHFNSPNKDHVLTLYRWWVHFFVLV
jgi:hypothetical protein